jgi:vancomycin permeability regulator SanA
VKAGKRAHARTLLLGAGVLLAIALAALIVIDVSVRLTLLGHLYRDADSAAAARVTLVLGAEVYPDGRPSPALESRLDVAMELLRRGKTNGLLMSGGNGTFEVDAMRAYVMARGVAPEAISIDDSGGERSRAARMRAPPSRRRGRWS